MSSGFIVPMSVRDKLNGVNPANAKANYEKTNNLLKCLMNRDN